MKPALTAEEWDALRKQRDANPLAVGAAAPVELQTASSLHGLIAFMLDGQPFGFTRHDVWIIRRLADEIQDRMHPGAMRTYREALALADRIEALLPPEPPSVQPDTNQQPANQ